MELYTHGLARLGVNPFRVKGLVHHSRRRLTTRLLVNLALLGGTSVSMLCWTLGSTLEEASAVFLAVSTTLAPYGAILARREDLQRRISGGYSREEMARERYLEGCEMIRATVANDTVREALIALLFEDYLDELRQCRRRLAA